MKKHEHLTDAMRAILKNWTNGYTCWISFISTEDKEDSIEEKWAEKYGTTLPAWRRQDKKQAHLPTAVSLSGPVIGHEKKREIVMMATSYALKAPPKTAWTSEKWKTGVIEFSDFRLTHEPRERGDYAWTWRLKPEVENGLLKYWKSLVMSCDGAEIAKDTHKAVRFYPMFGGVRRQLRRIFNGLRKLWTAKWKTPWPGPDPDHLPMMGGFKKAKIDQKD
jgi:hypothetical protein